MATRRSYYSGKSNIISIAWMTFNFLNEYEYSLFVSSSEDTEITSDFGNSRTILVDRNPMPSNEIHLLFKRSLNDDYDSYEVSDEWDFSSVTILDMQLNRRYYRKISIPKQMTVHVLN
jgi:hypothetical protein